MLNDIVNTNTTYIKHCCPDITTWTLRYQLSQRKEIKYLSVFQKFYWRTSVCIGDPSLIERVVLVECYQLLWVTSLWEEITRAELVELSWCFADYCYHPQPVTLSFWSQRGREDSRIRVFILRFIVICQIIFGSELSFTLHLLRQLPDALYELSLSDGHGNVKNTLWHPSLVIIN